MKDFLKETWFRVGVLLLLSVLCFSVLYVYGNYISSKSNLQSVTPSTFSATKQDNPTDTSIPAQQTIIYTNPAKEANQLKLETCIDEAEKEYNRIVLDLSAKVKNGELDSSYFAPSVDALIKGKNEQKADCLTKYN